MNVTHRLGEFIEQKKMSAHSFEMAAGLTKNVIQKPLKNGTSITLTTLSKISEKFPDLNLNWLITGTGEMIKGNEGVETKGKPPGNENNSGLEKQLLTIQQKLIDCMEENASLKKHTTGTKRTTVS